MTVQPKPILWGRLHGKEGYRMVLLKQGTKYAHILFMDGGTILKRIMPLDEMRYFKEYLNSTDQLSKVKRMARRFMGRNSMSKQKWEMSGGARKLLLEIANLKQLSELTPEL